MTIDTHLILVSAQAVPNITPVMDERFKPKNVVLLVSPDMANRADWLEQIYTKRGIKSRRCLIKDAWDIEHISQIVLDLLTEYKDGCLALNATGGTKPMSIAAYEVFRDLHQPVFYVHPEQDRVIWLYPTNQEGQDLADRIKLPEFLQAYGATVTAQGEAFGVPADDRELTEEIITRIAYYSKALGALNYLAQQATGSLKVELNPQQMKDYILADLIYLFSKHKRLSLDKNTLVFPTEEARFYVNGGWLEQHVWGICLNIKKESGIQDIGRSVQVERQHKNQPVRNELDITFLKDNRLYIIECKTKRFSGRDQTGGADSLYKLDTLKDLLGGLQAKAILITFTPPNKYDVQRAGDLRIALCAYQELPKLKEILLNWIC
ncbi:MAG: DUF1887 family CARF protein [Methylococcales bacterium]|nr:DUF1887 family CARF protein [Methylococcales bacterium]